MRKVVRGKRYDTATGIRVASWDNGYYRTDFHYCSEDLYRTARGNWFVHGEGNALSRWAEAYGSSRGPGEDIMPLSQAAAVEWLEERGLSDEIDEHFGDRVEDA